MWPWLLTLHEQMSQIAPLLLKRHNWVKLFWNPCINDSYDLYKLNLLPFYQLTFKCDLDLQPVWRNVSNDTATLQGEQLCRIILKSIYKCRSYGPDKLNFWPFYHLTFKCDIYLQPILGNVSNIIATVQVEQLCQIILKFMYKCRSYGPDKLNLWPFYHLTFKSDIDF